MYPNLPPGMPNFPKTAGNRATLAVKCAATGDIKAGVELVELLWKEEGCVTVDSLMMVAKVAVPLTPTAFDRLCDAFQLASLARYMREHGIKDPPVDPIESD